MKALMVARGLSSYQVSHLTGVPRPTISKSLNGHYNMRPASLRKIARYFGVSVEALYGPMPMADAPSTERIAAALERIATVLERRGK